MESCPVSGTFLGYPNTHARSKYAGYLAKCTEMDHKGPSAAYSNISLQAYYSCHHNNTKYPIMMYMDPKRLTQHLHVHPLPVYCRFLTLSPKPPITSITSIKGLFAPSGLRPKGFHSAMHPVRVPRKGTQGYAGTCRV